MSDVKFKAVGLDVFVRQKTLPSLKAGADIGAFELRVISNRGAKVWPGPTPKIDLTDVFCCRFMAKGAQPDFTGLLVVLEKLGFEWVHIEKLHQIDGKPAYSLAQGE